MPIAAAMDAAERFGLRLRKLRDQADISQPELARRSGLPQSSISTWEAGITEPRWSAVVALAKALGVDTTAFEDLPEDGASPGQPDDAD
jgi:transcriptional regulator with XRE-family HTH domain